MTAIAFRDGVLAVDSIVTNDGYRLDSEAPVKVYVDPKGEYLVAGSGSASLVQRFFKWFEFGEHGPAPTIEPSDSACIIAYCKDGSERQFTHEGEERAHRVFSGNGHFQFLIGAMAAGASAVDAVAACCNYSTSAAWPIRVYRFGQPVEVISREQWEAGRTKPGDARAAAHVHSLSSRRSAL